jgi:hypothetical protein
MGKERRAQPKLICELLCEASLADDPAAASNSAEQPYDQYERQEERADTPENGLPIELSQVASVLHGAAERQKVNGGNAGNSVAAEN